MDVLAYILNILSLVLAKLPIPSWVVTAILDVIKRYITPDLVAALEKEAHCYICAKLKILAGPNPSEVEKQVLDGVEKLLGCSACAPAAPAA